MADIKVIIEGPQESGKTRLTNLFRYALRYLATDDLRDHDVEFVERTTPAASISTLNTAVDSSQVKEAIEALNDLADAAVRAKQAIEAL